MKKMLKDLYNNHNNLFVGILVGLAVLALIVANVMTMDDINLVGSDSYSEKYYDEAIESANEVCDYIYESIDFVERDGEVCEIIYGEADSEGYVDYMIYNMDSGELLETGKILESER